ncbi:hypothetical protein BDZ91DRAFT_780114 [Kalaharituber pfeilii]|nr:hypothetical protein BDZ91DRAFT_780114 [Kalaharituber pfeilii]
MRTTLHENLLTSMPCCTVASVVLSKMPCEGIGHISNLSSKSSPRTSKAFSLTCVSAIGILYATYSTGNSGGSNQNTTSAFMERSKSNDKSIPSPSTYLLCFAYALAHCQIRDARLSCSGALYADSIVRFEPTGRGTARESESAHQVRGMVKRRVRANVIEEGVQMEGQRGAWTAWRPKVNNAGQKQTNPQVVSSYGGAGQSVSVSNQSTASVNTRMHIDKLTVLVMRFETGVMHVAQTWFDGNYISQFRLEWFEIVLAQTAPARRRKRLLSVHLDQRGIKFSNMDKAKRRTGIYTWIGMGGFRDNVFVESSIKALPIK